MIQRTLRGNIIKGAPPPSFGLPRGIFDPKTVQAFGSEDVGGDVDQGRAVGVESGADGVLHVAQ